MPAIFDALPGVEVPVGSISTSLAAMWADNAADGRPTPEADDAKATQVNFVLHLGINTTPDDTTRQFETVATHEDFITSGSKIGVKYGQYGQGSGRMPGFGPRSDDSCEIPPDPGTGGAPVSPCTYPAILSTEQIAAIVAYERSL